MRFPRVQPMSTRVPWSAPGTIEALPQSARAAAAIASGSVVQARDAAPVRESHRYAQINGSVAFQVTALSALVLPAPQNFRNMLMMRNTSGASIFIDFGRDATNSAPLELVPGAMILFDTVVPQDDVYAIAPLGAAGLSIAFSNINFLESAG
jgi:hypothetical protein